MKHQYLYGLQRGEKVYGIQDEEVLDRLISSGSLLCDDMLFCYRRGMWSQAGDLPELKARFAAGRPSRRAMTAVGEAGGLTGFASVSCTGKLMGAEGTRSSGAGGAEKQNSESSGASATGGSRRGKQGLLLLAIVLLLLLMSLLIAARLYYCSASEKQLSYRFDTAVTAGSLAAPAGPDMPQN